MVRLRLTSLLAAAVCSALAIACSKEIVVVECDAHDEEPAPDAGPRADARVTDGAASDAGAMDGGGAMDGASPSDGALTPDAGAQPCDPYCIRSLGASATRVNVREMVTLTPVVDNPRGISLTFRVPTKDQLVYERKPMRPALVPAEIDVSFTVDPRSGVATFQVLEVPPWFIATTVRLKVFAKGPAQADPEISAEVPVHVRGNTLLSSDSDVYAVASDGRPARATRPRSMQGQLLVDLVSSPKALLLRSDGTLLVYEAGTTPHRIKVFTLTGEDSQAGTFAFEDAMGARVLQAQSCYSCYQLAELPDGRIAVVDREFSRNIESRVTIWNADGTFSRYVTPPVNDIWAGIAANARGELLVSIRDSATSRVIRIDPSTGAFLSPHLTDTLPDDAHAVTVLADGRAYVAGDDYVIELMPGGGRGSVTNLPGGPSTIWRVLTPYDDGRVLASRSAQLETGNVAIISARMVQGDLRQMGTNNAVINPSGVAYLE